MSDRPTVSTDDSTAPIEFRPALVVIGTFSAITGIVLILLIAFLPVDPRAWGLEFVSAITGLTVVFGVLLIGGGFGVLAVASQQWNQSRKNSTPDK
ncbi:MAG: hypothetical protein ACO3FE_09230 [Planctomycetaceae bacterium]